jgi:hypothetical protein
MESEYLFYFGLILWSQKKMALIMAVASIAHHTSTIASCMVHVRLMWDFLKTVACYPVSLHIH